MYPRPEDPRGKAFVDPEFKIWVGICALCESEGAAITEAAAQVQMQRPHPPRHATLKWLQREDERWYAGPFAIKEGDEGWTASATVGAIAPTVSRTRNSVRRCSSASRVVPGSRMNRAPHERAAMIHDLFPQQTGECSICGEPAFLEDGVSGHFDQTIDIDHVAILPDDAESDDTQTSAPTSRDRVSATSLDAPDRRADATATR